MVMKGSMSDERKGEEGKSIGRKREDKGIPMVIRQSNLNGVNKPKSGPHLYY